MNLLLSTSGFYQSAIVSLLDLIKKKEARIAQIDLCSWGEFSQNI